MAATGVGHLTATLPDMVKAQKAAKSILSLWNVEPKIDNLSEEGDRTWKPEGDSDTHVEFRDVHFRYPSRPKFKVLHGLSLKIPRGKHVAFVGPSGSGKTTVMQLVQRLYDAESGKIVSRKQFIDELKKIENRGRKVLSNIYGAPFKILQFLENFDKNNKSGVCRKNTKKWKCCNEVCSI